MYYSSILAIIKDEAYNIIYCQPTFKSVIPGFTVPKPISERLNYFLSSAEVSFIRLMLDTTKDIVLVL